MAVKKTKQLGVKQVLAVQVILSFIVIGILVVLGGLLVFRLMGTEYTPFTSAWFIATVYLAFIIFQPAGTLFAARRELIEGRVALPAQTPGAKAGPVRNPWRMTLPVSIPVALCLTALAIGIIYLSGWKPTPTMTVVISLLYVIPHYLITSRFIEGDMVSLATNGPGSGAGVSKGAFFWSTFILPNIILQAIINGALANRGFHHEVMKLAQEFPDLQGFLPAKAVAADLAVTFMFVCNFTFLAAIMYTLTGVFVGIISLEGVKGKARHGFLMFLFMLLLGLVLGILYGAVLQGAGMANIPFAAAMVSKFACVVIAVYLGSKLALGWTSKKVLEHIAAQAGSN